MKFQEFSIRQLQALSWWCRNSPYAGCDAVICDGAVRSGKTVCMGVSFFALCGKTIRSLRRNLVTPLLPILKELGFTVHGRAGENMLEVTQRGRTNRFYLFGGKDEGASAMIQGITLAGILLDEVALMPRSFVEQALARCSVEGSKFWFNCNPDGPYHWFKVNWIDKSISYLGKERVRKIREEAEKEGKAPGLKKVLYVHFTMDDNLSLSEKIKERYRSDYNGVFFKRYILGLWAMAEGIIYDMFSEEKHVVDSDEVAASWQQDHGGSFWVGDSYVSCDYGTQNPTAFLLWSKGADGRWYCRREYYYSGRDKGQQKTDKEFSEDMTKWLCGEKIRAVVLDPAAASFKAQLEKDGYKVKKAKNDVLDGIRFVATLLNQGSILIDIGCVNLIKEFGSYIWDEKAAEHGEDKPVKMHDHALDGLRYMAYTIIRRLSGISVLK